MTRRLVIGITGSIATGKSTVLREFARYGIPTLSSDELAHRCLEPRHPCCRRVVQHFGCSILRPNKAINRRTLGGIVFTHPKERQWLERLIHPWVIKALKRFIQKHSGPVALDIPLLFEAHLEAMIDVIVLVDSCQKLQVNRLMSRNDFSKQEALRRIRSQWPLRVKRRRADYVLRNNDTLSNLRQQVQTLLAGIRRETFIPTDC